jgi:PAS domain S-box-containing protein
MTPRHHPLIGHDARVPSGDALRDLLAQVVEGSADAIFCHDREGVVTTWNAAAERLYGYSAVEMLGRRSDDLLPERTRVHLLETRAAALAGERIERFDSWHQRRDGALLPVSVSVSPLLDAAGTVAGAATSVADISDRVELDIALHEAQRALERQNETLVRSNRDLEQFAYVASHDLSEPLRVISGFVTQLERRYGDAFDERGTRYLHHIVEGTARMRALIDDLLEYSRFLRTDREVVAVRLDEVVASVLDRLQAQLEEAEADVQVGPLPVVRGDRGQLESLLQNLLSNAVKFTAADATPRVEISGAVEGSTAVLCVDDAGIGIEPEYRDRVFRMFQRLHVREAYAGTGIGLAIAQQIVELHGGTISIDDSPLGGARFRVTLPVVATREDDARGDDG